MLSSSLSGVRDQENIMCSDRNLRSGYLCGALTGKGHERSSLVVFPWLHPLWVVITWLYTCIHIP